MEALQDLRKRVQLSAASLPSVCLYTFLNTHQSLNTVEISSDAQMVAGGFANSEIKLWNVAKDHSLIFGSETSTMQEVDDSTLPYSSLLGHSGSVFATSFSPDNRFLLSASSDHTGTRHLLTRSDTPLLWAPYASELTNHGECLEYDTARLWSVDTKTNLVCYKGHNYPVWDCDFSPLGYYFATASHDRTARLWSTDRIFPLRIYAGHLSDVDVRCSLSLSLSLLLHLASDRLPSLPSVVRQIPSKL